MKENNIYVYIDGQNLNLGIKELGWNLDYKKFYIYLKEKYNASKIYYFIGYIESNIDLYNFLNSIGYILIFKKVSIDRSGKIKGNVDSVLILHCILDVNIYHKMILISGDGDFDAIVEYLLKHNKFYQLIIPNKQKFSKLLRNITPINKISFLNNCEFLEIKKTTEL